MKYLEYFVIIVLFLQLLIPLGCLVCIIYYDWCTRFKKKESFKEKSDSLTSSFNSFTERTINNKYTTFTNFHFHADEEGFLRIGDFLLQWGVAGRFGGDNNSGRRRATFPMSYAPNKPAGAVCLPFNSKGGRYSLRIEKLYSDKFILSDANGAECPYLYLVYGFKPVDEYTSKMTYDADKLGFLPKRMKHLAQHYQTDKQKERELAGLSKRSTYRRDGK